MILTDRKPVAKKADEPGKMPSSRWINVWRGTKYEVLKCEVCGEMQSILKGCIIDPCCHVYPSKEIAEHKAQRGIEAMKAQSHVFAEWLGAEPAP